MKRLCVAVVFFAVVACSLGSFLRAPAPVAEAGEKPPCAPLIVTDDGVVVQDMNGDGAFDAIGDALRLLTWAFLGGPAPEPPCTAGGSAGLPDTGQTTCFDRVGEALCTDFSPVTCPYFAEDGPNRTGCPNDGNRFTDNGDGTVTDNCTGLQWQKDTADVNGNGQVQFSDQVLWCEALVFCSGLSFAGHTDWRLPNVRELESIVDHGRFSPAIDPVFSAPASAPLYWSSTSSRNHPGEAFHASFIEGNVFSFPKGEQRCHVRAVRGGVCAPVLVAGGGEVIQDMNGDRVFDAIGEALNLLGWAFLGGPPPVSPCGGVGPVGLPDTGQTTCFDRVGEANCTDFSPVSCPYFAEDGPNRTGCPNDGNRFTDNGDGTVTDSCTGLQWQQVTADVNGDGEIRLDGSDTLVWCDALVFCTNLSYAGHTDWRLPNVRELESIVDYGRRDPMIDPVFAAVSSTYWSSTSSRLRPNLAFSVNFNVGTGVLSGLVEGRRKDFLSFVRAVRGGR